MQRKILGKIILIVIGILFIVVTIFFVIRHTKKEMVLEKAREHGYSIEFSDSTMFYINEGAVTYYYSLDMSGINFIKYEIVVEEPDKKVKKGELTVSVQNKDKDGKQIEGSYDDTRTLIADDGTEKNMHSGMFFICNNNFDRSSLVTTGWIDAEQKAIEAYESVTGYVPVEELKQYYNRALTICNQLNE